MPLGLEHKSKADPVQAFGLKRYGSHPSHFSEGWRLRQAPCNRHVQPYDLRQLRRPICEKTKAAVTDIDRNRAAFLRERGARLVERLAQLVPHRPHEGKTVVAVLLCADIDPFLPLSWNKRHEA